MIEQFISEIMQATGGAPEYDKVQPGKLGRFSTSDKRNDENGWYRLFEDQEGGVFGCWRQGISETWQARQPATPEQRAAFTEKVKQARQEAAKIEEQQRAECREWCIKTLSTAKDATSENPYLKRKACNAYAGVKSLRDAVVIPVQDLAGIVHGVQFIQPDGSKKFKTGTVKAGNFFKIGTSKNKTVVICEGYATGASIHQATGHAVVIAFDAGNLSPVAQGIRSKYPAMTIIIAADDDRATEGNPGLSKAIEAARVVGGLLARPVFPESRGVKDTDFNDLARLAGLLAVKACIDNAAIPEQGPNAETQPQAEPESTQLEPWPEPIPFGEIQTPEIPCSILPGWLGEYAAAVTENTQTPAGMSAMMALAVVAACCQKRFKVARTPEHVEPLSIWPVTALPPANRKTAVVNAFTGPLTAWEKERGESQRQERSRITAIREVTESRIKALHVQAAKADDATDRNRLIEEACRLKEQMPDPLNPPRIFTGDVTAERLQALMMEHGERMALLSDEGGIFAVMAGLYTGGKANIDVFLKGHAGSSVRVDRQDRTAHLDEPALTFGLCIQPDIIRRLSETSFRGNGCLARFLFCLPASNIGTRSAYSSPIPESVKVAYHAGIQSLLSIPPVFNEHGKEQARIITLDHSAARTWEAFFDFIEHNMKPGGELEPLQDWAGKLAGAALRIAGLMAIVEQGEAAKQINEQTMTNALNLCELLIPHAQAAFELMAGDDAQQDAKHVFTWILEKGSLTFKQADVYRELRRFNDADRLNKALRVLTGRHIISEPMKHGTGGRPSISFEVNPTIFEIRGTV